MIALDTNVISAISKKVLVTGSRRDSAIPQLYGSTVRTRNTGPSEAAGVRVVKPWM